MNLKENYKLSISFFIIFLLINLLVIDNKSFAQWSKPQLTDAIKRLEKRGLLDPIAQKSKDDPQQIAIRADILIACSEIIRELDKLKDSGSGASSSQVGQFQKTINNLSQRVNAIEKSVRLPGSDSELIKNIFSEVDSYLASNMKLLAINDSIDEIEQYNLSIKEKLISLDEKLGKIADLKKTDLVTRVNQNRIMAITSLVLVAVVPLLAAR